MQTKISAFIGIEESSTQLEGYKKCFSPFTLCKHKLTELEAAREIKKLRELNQAFHCYYYEVPLNFNSPEEQVLFWLSASPLKKVYN